jgi:hypothetical protein
MGDERRTWPTFPIPSLEWADREAAPPIAATLWLRPIRMTHVDHVFGDHPGILVGVGIDGRPSMVMLVHGLSARGALHLLRMLAEGSPAVASRPQTTDASPSSTAAPDFLPLDASPELWAWLCTALGNVCARLPLLPDESNLLPTAAA